MNQEADASLAASPVPMEVDFSDIRAALAAGWEDFRRAPVYGLLVSAIFVAAGWFIAWQLTQKGQHWWVFVLAIGFPLVGPFAAVGFYEASHRLERGERPGIGALLTGIFAHGRGQVPFLAAIMLMVFMIWAYLAHMIFALFLGLSTMTNITSSFEVLLTPNGLTMLAVGTCVGAALSFVIFASTAVGLPLVVDRDIDLVTAIITSWQVVLGNPAPMLFWGVCVAVLLFLGTLMAFLGLFIVLPLLGHATWHLYRRAVSFEDQPTAAA